MVKSVKNPTKMWESDSPSRVWCHMVGKSMNLRGQLKLAFQPESNRLTAHLVTPVCCQQPTLWSYMCNTLYLLFSSIKNLIVHTFTIRPFIFSIVFSTWSILPSSDFQDQFIFEIPRPQGARVCEVAFRIEGREHSWRSILKHAGTANSSLVCLQIHSI